MEDIPEYIIKHRKDQDGRKLYYVKWVGCDIAENTWETEDKLQSEWPDAIKKYRIERKKRKEKPIPTTTASVDPDVVFNYTSHTENWEEAVESVDYVERSKLPGLVVYIKWKNGYKSVHHSTEVYAKCPQKMLDFYESCRRFRPVE